MLVDSHTVVNRSLPTGWILTASLVALVVTAGGSASPSPRQSANGRVAFVYRGRSIVTNPDGTGQWPLGKEFRYSPGDWSPDGTRLVVMGYGDERHASLYLFDGRGRKLARLTSNDSLGQGERDPSFSPDGRQIAYESYQNGHSAEIWAMNVDGTSQRYVPAGYPSVDPDWSPDGGRIALTSYVGTTAPDIWVMNYDGVEGSERKGLTANPGIDENPSWSPDGTRIAFDSDRSGNLDVYTMKADGTDVRQLTTSPAHDAIPEWSPDGKRIAFVSNRTGKRGAFVMDADGRNVTQISSSIDGDAGPAWQPLARRPRATATSGSRCTIWGTEEDDLLVGTPGRDVLCGLGGNDRILGGDGRDVIVGGTGNDSIVGGPGTDVVLAGPGHDAIDARDGDPDEIQAGAGRDIALVDRELDRGSSLARAFDPDPGNLMRGRPVRASSATPSNPVEYAVDGYRNTFWDPDHPSWSWIQVDLGRPATVARVEFLVFSEEPELSTHFGVFGERQTGGWHLLATFHRESASLLRRGSSHLFRYSPAHPWHGIRGIRVVTRAMGGLFFWKELRAYSR